MDITPEAIKNQLAAINKTVSDTLAKVNEEVKSTGSVGRANSEALKALTGSIEEVTARVLEMEQAGTSQRDIDAAVSSVGAEFTGSDAYAQFATGNTTKASFSVENNAVIGGDATVAPDRRAGVIGGALRGLRVLDALPQGNTTSNSIEYTRELLYTNAAAETAEGDAAAYPESTLTFELVTAAVRNIGHFIYISKQMLEDAPTIASYIDGRLRYGVEYRKDLQALRGNGVGQNLSGLFNAGNYAAITGAATGDDAYKNVRRAIAQVALAEYTATAIFLNPTDAANIDLTTDLQERYIASNPRMRSLPTLWGLPVIETAAMTPGSFLTGAFDMASQFTNRRGVLVEMSDADGTNFTKDMVTLKASARAALEIYRPASLVGGLLITP